MEYLFAESLCTPGIIGILFWTPGANKKKKKSNVCFMRAAQDWELGMLLIFLVLCTHEYWECGGGLDDLSLAWIVREVEISFE